MIILNQDQKEAYDKILNFINNPTEKTFMLTGSAGTGKTTLITEIIKNTNLSKKKIALCATTNKAVSVMQNMYNIDNKNISFSTIHKILKIKRVIDSDGIESFIVSLDDHAAGKYKTKSISYYDIVVIDEASMISKGLFDELSKLLSRIKGKIIFIGDSFQLPPINEIKSKVFTNTCLSFTLKKIERSKNNIVTYSNALRDNIEFNKKIKYKTFLSNGVSMTRGKEFEWINNYVDTYKNDKNSIILAYTNSRCDFLNNKVRQKIFPNSNNKKYIVNDLIVFNNFYQNNKKYYSSQHSVITDIKEDIYYVDKFPLESLFNLKMDLKKTRNVMLKPKKKENCDEELLCPICFENDREFSETSCGHSFCVDCINIWVKKHNCCPYCRMTIVNDNVSINKEDELSSLINNLKNKINNLSYKVYLVTLIDSQEPGDIVRVIHETDKKKFDTDLKLISDQLLHIKSLLKRKKKDRLINTIIKRLWEFYYYQIIDMFADISYGYCITVHKSQGSTYNNVFVDVSNIVQYNDNQTKNCLYTAITRASNNLEIFIK